MSVHLSTQGSKYKKDIRGDRNAGTCWSQGCVSGVNPSHSQSVQSPGPARVAGPAKETEPTTPTGPWPHAFDESVPSRIAAVGDGRCLDCVRDSGPQGQGGIHRQPCSVMHRRRVGRHEDEQVMRRGALNLNATMLEATSTVTCIQEE